LVVPRARRATEKRPPRRSAETRALWVAGIYLRGEWKNREKSRARHAREAETKRTEGERERGRERERERERARERKTEKENSPSADKGAA
jgi:hypothetical protein